LLVNYGSAYQDRRRVTIVYDAFVSGASADEIVSLGFDGINARPSLFQYAKAMGYKTYFFDGQRTYYWGGLKEDTAFIDVYLSTHELGNPEWETEQVPDIWRINRKEDKGKLDRWELDDKIADTVRDIYSASTGNFILCINEAYIYPT
jgi:hypothetical protein